ncbi:MAG TPA: hypothetical protein VFV13_14565 [Acidimicrobiia bacterium]|nr:hypothetical protein [Acidimicrobiia bacterium]
MADQQIEPVGCLGRLLTLLGILWLGAVVFAGVFGLRDNPGTIGALIGSTVPALLFIAAGRALSRRAAARRETVPVTPPAERPFRTSTSSADWSAPKSPTPVAPPSAPPSAPSRPARPAPAAEPEPDTPPSLPPPLTPPPPKTSQEMIEEARRRWGGGPRPRDEGL